MADRYRDKPFPPDEPFGREEFEAAERSTASDPLAELARLIGQTDPFSTFGRGEAPSARPEQYDADDDASGYQDEAATTPSWMRNRPPAQDASYGDPDPYDAREANQRGHEQSPQFGQQRFDAPPSRAPQGNSPDPSRYENILFGQRDRDPQQDTRVVAQNDDYNDDRYDDARYDDNADADAPRSRRGGTVTVVVVLLLAVVGTAAAFGYRTFIGSPRSGEPPVIKADAGPNKVVPAGSGDGKISDRVGDKGSERVVSREEQPVDINGKAQPRVVFPPLTPNANPPNVSSANTASRPTGAGVGNGTLGGGEEPRKIRTLTIRPDGDQAAAAPETAPAPVARAPQAAARVVAPSNTASASAPAGGPIALTPQPQATAPAPEARARVASVAPAAGGGSGSFVQISSQKTEADAQASFRAMQAKYSELLGSRSPSIRRADLGEKGIFYRALVGPFGTTDEATQFCVNLKSAGGQCIVQR